MRSQAFMDLLKDVEVTTDDTSSLAQKNNATFA